MHIPPAGASEPVVLDLPRCDQMWVNGTGDHANNCLENGGLGGCNGIVGDMTNLGPIPSGQLFCGDHRIQGCDKVSKAVCGRFQQFLCTTVPILLEIHGVTTLVSPGVGFPTEFRVAKSCSEAGPDEYCEQRGCDWNIPDSNPNDWNGCPPAIAHHYPLCDCRPHFCGDGVRDSGEECDDGNKTNGDGCNSACTLECGNDIIDANEQCDDGNNVNGDGCSSFCKNECGNGYVDANEECDDGNLTKLDGCDSHCVKECGPILDDPGRIKLVWGPDEFKSHGRIPYVTMSGPVRFRLMNNNTTLYDTYFYVTKVKRWWIEKGPGYLFKIGGHINRDSFYLRDLRSELGAFTPDMMIRIDVDGKCFSHKPNWRQKRNVWVYYN